MSAPVPSLSAPAPDDVRQVDALLDEALAASFPASDPIALSVASRAGSAAADEGRTRRADRPLPGTLNAALAGLLADLTALWFRTKGFHWHVSGPAFRDLHLMFDAQAGQILAAVDPVAERLRKRGAPALTGIGEVAARSGMAEATRADLSPAEMVRRLLDDHRALLARLATVRRAAEAEGDAVTASKLDDWTDEAEARAWFLRATLGEG